MEKLASFIARLDNVLNEEREKITRFQEEQTTRYHERQQRLTRYEEVIQDLIPLLAPRLRALAEKFKDIVQVKPVLRAHTGGIVLDFRSSLARIRFPFEAYPDRDVQNILFEHKLQIIPVRLKYDFHME